MICGIDNVLKDAQPTVVAICQQLVHDLSSDFNLECDAAAVLTTPQGQKLQEACQSFAVWLVHDQQRGH
ncbi:MAG: hypothetical protein HQL60_04105 [Magnetococcales bacterium]|nr:hypothetical protein [Magnetococcales bacterium]